MNDPAIHEPKAELRRRMREALRRIAPEQRAGWSRQIIEHLVHTKSWPGEGGVVAIFGGMSLEPDVLPLLPWLEGQGRAVALFGIEGDVMIPYRVRTLADLVKGPLGVLEPRRSSETALKIADLGAVLVPGLAFGRRDGFRLGRGKGHYDRVLGHPDFQGQPVGVAFDLQILDVVPAESHDIPMPRLLSEAGWSEIS